MVFLSSEQTIQSFSALFLGHIIKDVEAKRFLSPLF